MAQNLVTRVFDSIAELVLRVGSNRSNAKVLGYYLPGDGGGSDFYWDSTSTLPHDGGMVFEVQGISTGRWLRDVESGSLNIKWFGAKSYFLNGNVETAFDNIPVFERTQAYLKTPRGRRFSGILFPYDAEGGYFFASPLEIRMNGHVSGHTPGASGERVPLGFKGTAGVRICSTAHPKGGCYDPVLENFTIASYNDVGPYLPYTEGLDGLLVETRAHIRNLYLTGWRGHGIKIYANIAGAFSPDINPETGVPYTYGTNANLWRADDIDTQSNAGCGIIVQGGDTNAGVATRINSVKNGRWGINDKSFLGCTWINCQVSDNAVYGGLPDPGNKYTALELTPKVYAYSGSMVTLTSGGVTYFYTALKDSVGVSPIINASNSTWKITAGYQDGVPAYDPLRTYGLTILVSYEGAIYKCIGHPTNIPPTGHPLSTTYWEPATEVGRNALYTYEPWNSTTSFKKCHYYAAMQDYIPNAGPGVDQTLPAPGTNNQFWSYQGDFDLWGLSQKWTPTFDFVGGGGWTAWHISNRTLFFGCYAEGGQAHNYQRGGALTLGGFNIEVANIGSGTEVGGDPNGGISTKSLQLTKNGITFPFTGGIIQSETAAYVSFSKPLFIEGPTINFGNGNPHNIQFDSATGKNIFGGVGDNGIAKHQFIGKVSVSDVLYVKDPNTGQLVDIFSLFQRKA